MNWFWLNMPLAAAFFVAWTGVPLWLLLKKRPDRVPAPQAPAVQAPAAQVPAPMRQAEPVAPHLVPAGQRSKELAAV